MTDSVDPSIGSVAQAFMVAQAIKNHGVVGDGWIVPDTDDHAAGHPAADVSGAPLNAFNHANSNGLDVTIDTGEAFVGGSWLARDAQSTVTLADGTNSQTVAVGYEHDAPDSVLVALDSAFDPYDEYVPVWEFDTASGSVTASEDVRPIGKQNALGTTEIADGAEIGRFISTAVADSTNGTPGGSAAELFRAGGATSDLVFIGQGAGTDRMNIAWNCEYDGNANEWVRIVGGEEAYRLAFSWEGIRIHSATEDTAGTIPDGDWHTYEFDDDSGDFIGNGDVIFDASEGHVPQAQQGGPAGDLSSHPLSASDIADGPNSGLDADTIDGFNAGELQGGDWTTVAHHEDTDPNTLLDWFAGTFNPTYDFYKLEYAYTNQSTEKNNMRMRVNTDSTTNYHTLARAIEGDTDVHDSYTSWVFIGRTFEEGEISHGTCTVRGHSPPGHSGNRAYPTMKSNSMGWAYGWNAVGGTLENDHPTVDNIRFFSRVEATGHVTISGRTL